MARCKRVQNTGKSIPRKHYYILEVKTCWGRWGEIRRHNTTNSLLKSETKRSCPMKMLLYIDTSIHNVKEYQKKIPSFPLYIFRWSRLAAAYYSGIFTFCPRDKFFYGRRQRINGGDALGCILCPLVAFSFAWQCLWNAAIIFPFYALSVATIREHSEYNTECLS